MHRAILLFAVLTAIVESPRLSFAHGGGGGGFGGQAGGAAGGGGFGGQAGGFGGQAGGLGGQAGGLGGAGGFGQGGANTGQNGTGQQQGQAFLGRNTNTNQFLGRNAQGQGQTGNLNQNGAGNRRGGANRGANGQNGFNQQQGGMAGGNGSARQAAPIRPRQKVAFTYPTPQLQIVSVKLETRLNKMTALKSVNLSVDPSGELVMKGEVASVSEAKLAENLARMEPGVRTVRNELSFPSPVSDE